MSKVLKNNVLITLFLIVTSAYFCIWFSRFGGENICSDGLWYYEYFIRTFINHNINGSGLIKYPAGTMLLQLPFLLMALIYSKLLGIDLEGGLSLHFQRAVFSSALFYYIVTIVMLYKLAKKMYSKKASVLMCICLTFGTMLPVYICEKSSFSHVYGFFICTSFFVFVDYYEQNRNKKNAVILDLILGILLGFAVIIRNTNIVIGSGYLFYKVDSFKAFVVRIKNKILRPRIVLQTIGCILVYNIQIVFWKKMTGEWILYSYGEEAFIYWKKPQVLKVLFSDGKGLFIYCPVLMIAIISMIAFRKENKKYGLAQWIIFAAITYFISSWWCWWLGSAYGERMYCDILCIFSLPLASFFHNLDELSYVSNTGEELKTINRYISGICYIICFLCVVLNMAWINGTRSGAISDNFGTWYDLKNQFYNYLVR